MALRRRWFLSPDGAPLDAVARADFAKPRDLCFVAGRYEGIDQRWIDVNVDAVVRWATTCCRAASWRRRLWWMPASACCPARWATTNRRRSESFADDQGGRLDWPQYALTGGDEPLPLGLSGGDHAVIQRWRLEQALARTWRRRPDCWRALNCRSKSVH